MTRFRIIAGLATVLLIACSDGEVPRMPESRGAISNLSLLFSKPLDCDGRLFDGYVYLHSEPGYYSFWPSAKADLSSKIIVMPGTGEQLFSRRMQFHQGQRIHIRGTIRLQIDCFAKRECVPFEKPIAIDDLQFMEP